MKAGYKEYTVIYTERVDKYGVVRMKHVTTNDIKTVLTQEFPGVVYCFDGHCVQSMN